MINFSIEVFAIFLIWVAVGIGRNKTDNIKLFSRNWWIQFLLVVVSVIIIKVTK